MVKKNMNKVSALVIAGVAVAAGITVAGIAFYNIQPETVVVNNTEIVTEYVDVPVETIVEVPYNVTEYVNVSVENPINLDMESELALLQEDVDNYDEFLQYAEDKGSDLDLAIFDDAKDVIHNFMKEQTALSKVVNYVEDHIADKLEDASLVDDEDDVDFKRAKIDYDEYEVSDVDYDDNQFTFEFDVIVKDDGDTKTFTVEASYDDGDVEIESVN